MPLPFAFFVRGFAAFAFCAFGLRSVLASFSFVSGLLSPSTLQKRQPLAAIPPITALAAAEGLVKRVPWPRT